MDRKVTFVKIMGILFLCCALFILGVSFVIGPSINTLSGVFALILSILYLSNPAIVYNDNEIYQKNLFGMTLKTYSFQRDKITVQDQTIYVNGSKLRTSKSMLVKKEYDALLDHIQSKTNAPDFVGTKFQPKTDDNILDSDLIGK